jgi:hypothetical protein
MAAPNLKEVFSSLPHVDEVWVTADGHFHLDKNSGGKREKREDHIKPADEKAGASKTAEPVIEAKQLQDDIATLATLSTAEEVENFVTDKHRDVQEAGKARIEEIKEEKKNSGGKQSKK